MQSYARLRKRSQFTYTYKRGRSKSLPELSLIVARSNRVLVGFAVGKKVGGAVVRNRVKRRLRAVLRPLVPRLKPGSYVFIARPSAAAMAFDRMEGAVADLIQRQGCFK